MPENVNTYLQILLNDNELLKNTLTAYLNNMVSLKATYPDETPLALSKKITGEEKANLINIINTFRAYATRIRISINVIKDKFESETLTEIETDYKAIRDNAMPEYDTCERFVQNINDSLGKQLNVAATFQSQA